MVKQVLLIETEDLKGLIFQALKEYDQSKTENRVYYKSQVARILHKSPNTVKKLCELGEIETTKSGMITQKALDSYLGNTNKSHSTGSIEA